MKKNRLKPVLALLALMTAVNSHAKPEIYDFDWRDKRYHSKQSQQIEDLVREHFGVQLHQTKADLPILQRLILKGIISKENTEQLQATGVVLGNVMANDFGLSWRIYEDSQGRSRALCTTDARKPECLFPITMLSRRIEVGIMPNVEEIYRNAYSLIESHLQKLPYEVE